MNINTKLNYINIINKLKQEFTINTIEGIIVSEFLRSNNIDIQYARVNQLIDSILTNDIQNEIENENINLQVKEFEEIEFLFELLLSDESKNENGIVFTQEFIVNKIISLISQQDNEGERILDEVAITEEVDIENFLDPACGCGAFLRGASICLKNKYNWLTYKEIFENYIFGIDIEEENIRRAKIILTLHCIINDECYEDINFNLLEANTLKIDIVEEFKLENGFKYIIGNPPYVNAHDLSKESKSLLKNFETTITGGVNIFYAFIEHSMKFLNENGKLSFIIPNNFLTIKSAKNLRKFIKDNKHLNTIIDFTDNMIFKPVRTYNCIIVLDKNQNQAFRYSTIDDTNNLEDVLTNPDFYEMQLDDLNDDGWHLLNEEARRNINKIENVGSQIKKLVSTGIATLKDESYILDGFDENRGQYYKVFNDRKYYIETEMTKPLYKVSNIVEEDIESCCKRIIFPYVHSEQHGYRILNEVRLENEYPLLYRYFNDIRHILDSRDNGKPNNVAWYAYGRSQGLSRFGRKLLFPTFSNRPKFTLIDYEDALFCNGYAVFDDNELNIDLSILQKILNSFVMDYYVRNTSYSIDGGYMCYQKKYIEKFSIPNFTDEEILYLGSNDITQEDVDNFLIRKYDINI